MIPSFSEKKLPWIKYIKNATNKINSEIKVYISNIKSDTFLKNINSNFLTLPKVNEDNKIKILMILKKNNINIILPARDEDNIFWSKNINFFAYHKIKIMISKYKNILNCYDKFKFYNFCIKNKFKTPKTWKNFNDLDKSKKLLIKSRYGSSQDKILRNMMVKNLTNKKIPFSDPLYQEQIKGKEISVDAWIAKKNIIKGIIIRERKVIKNGEAVFTKIINNKKIEDEFVKIIKKLNLRYHINLQAILKNEKIYLIECNPRFGGISTFSINLGLDSFYWSFLEATNNHKLIDLIKFIPSNFKKQFRYNSDFVE